MATTDFPCALLVLTACLSTANRRTVDIPFPTPRLAQHAHAAIGVDPELSPLVQRQLVLVHANEPNVSPLTGGVLHAGPPTVLRALYKAATPRMLRVASNGYFESVRLVLATMAELDVDVVEAPWKGDGNAEVDSLTRVQGIAEAGRLAG